MRYLTTDQIHLLTDLGPMWQLACDRCGVRRLFPFDPNLKWYPSPIYRHGKPALMVTYAEHFEREHRPCEEKTT